ncbi:hypothetical protein V8D89_002820 [Ganoderma adspersum]
MADAPSSSTATVAIPNVFANLGVGFLGVIASSIVYGITCIQTFQYYHSRRSKSDHASLRYLVFILWILDSVHESFAIQMFYFYLVENFNNPSAGDVALWSLPSCILVNGFIQLSVKTYYIMRIWRISHNPYLVVLCGVLNVVRFGLNMYYPARFFSLIPTGGTRSEIENRLQVFGTTGLGLEALTGALISATGVYEMLKRRGSIRKSNDIIVRMVIITVATGTLSALFVTANFITYLAAPKTLYVLFFNFLIGKMDINALLTSLNGRKYIVGDRTNPISLYDVSDSRGQIQMGSAADQPATQVKSVVCKVDIERAYSEM